MLSGPTSSPSVYRFLVPVLYPEQTSYPQTSWHLLPLNPACGSLLLTIKALVLVSKLSLPHTPPLPCHSVLLDPGFCCGLPAKGSPCPLGLLHPASILEQDSSRPVTPQIKAALMKIRLLTPGCGAHSVLVPAHLTSPVFL